MTTGSFNDAWKSLLPRGVQVRAGKISDDVIPLTRRELASVGEVSTDRKREFQSGRTYAKRALAAFGVENVELPIGLDRAPIWPDGFVGSVTHVRMGLDGFCAAAVARSNELSAIGIDAEYGGSISPEIWPTILTRAELDQLNGIPAPKRECEVLRRWCAKEATAKALRLPFDPRVVETKRADDHSNRTFLVFAPGDSRRWHAFTANSHGLMLAAVTAPFR